MEKMNGILQFVREESIKVKEGEIKMMKRALEKARDAAQIEGAQLMGLVRTLELKIAEHNQKGRQERWVQQQATAKASAFDREADLTCTLLECEREQINTLKESILAEQERAMLMFMEQRLALEVEKSRLETSAKLNKCRNPEIARAEIEAAELTDCEREKLQRQQYKLESLNRSLRDKQPQLPLKECYAAVFNCLESLVGWDRLVQTSEKVY